MQDPRNTSDPHRGAESEPHLRQAPSGPGGTIEFDPELEWMLPLIELAQADGLVSPGAVGRLLVQVAGETSCVPAAAQLEAGGHTASSPGDPRPGEWDSPYGSCWPIEQEREAGDSHPPRFEIRIATASPLSIFFHGVELRPLPREEQLDTLAHELAHTRHEQHGPEHARLTEEILGGFVAFDSSNPGVGTR